jgi:outer membrane protein
LQIEADSLLSIPPQSNEPTAPLTYHPIALAQQARVEQLTAQKKVLDRSYFPRFDLQSTIYGRGSGANTDGTIQTGTGGLGFDRSNWAVGLTATFPAFDFFSIRAQKQIVTANENAERARYRQVTNDLTGQLQQAQAVLEGARLVAEKTPIELQAAREAETRARARYDAGLASIVEVADAQGLLVQAQIDDALARLAIWNDLGTVAAAHGDLAPFLEMVRKNAPGGH